MIKLTSIQKNNNKNGNGFCETIAENCVKNCQ